MALEHAARSVEREGKKLRGGDELLTVDVVNIMAHSVRTDILMPLPGTPQMSGKKWKQVQAPVQPTPGNQRSGSIAPRQWARALREELPRRGA